MKKYIILVIASIFLIAICLNIPKINDSFAKKCATVPILSATASEKITCKGVIKEEDGFFASIQITEDDISLVKIGQKVQLHCNALGDAKLSGKIIKLSENAYQTTYAGMVYTVIDAKVELNEQNKNLKKGYSVTAEVILNEVEDATILPYEAVAREKSGRYYVYRIIDGWAVKEYLDVVFEDEKGVVVEKNKDYTNICENPESFTEDRERVNKNGDD